MSNYDFYHSRQWKRKREQILRRDKHLCRESIRYGRYVDATTVHHIFPLEEHPEWALEDWNLISLCEERHDAMHDRKTGRVTERGRRWQQRVSPHPSAFCHKERGTGEGKVFQ